MVSDSMQGVSKLNLGCGRFKKAGYINVDCCRELDPDVLHDLNAFPYPFPDSTFDVIEADHVFEHLNDPFGAMKEIHRILKNGAMLKLKVPHFSRGFTHPDHKRGFDVSFPYYFDPSFKGGYTGVQFIKIDMKYTWFAQPYLKRTVMPLPLYYCGVIFGKIADLFANIAPFVCSRFWCFLVGGFEELRFDLICKK